MCVLSLKAEGERLDVVVLERDGADQELLVPQQRSIVGNGFRQCLASELISTAETGASEAAIGVQLVDLDDEVDGVVLHQVPGVRRERCARPVR